MEFFGTYSLSYRPPHQSMDPEISMSISAEANLTQMLDFFKSFLMAAGYPVSPADDFEVKKDFSGIHLTDPFAGNPRNHEYVNPYGHDYLSFNTIDGK